MTIGMGLFVAMLLSFGASIGWALGYRAAIKDLQKLGIIEAFDTVSDEDFKPGEC